MINGINRIMRAAATVADPSGRLSEYVESSTYCADPASVFRHRSYSGGLADHCLGVYLHLRALGAAYCASTGPADTWPDQAYALIALCHDLCKVGTYQRCMKSQKRKGDDGKNLVDWRGKPVWEDVEAFEYVARPGIVLGHGDASLFDTLRLFPDLLRSEAWGEDAATAIRYHMGPYGAAQGEETLRLQDANRRPLVLLTQAADQLDTFGAEPSESVRARAAAALGISGGAYEAATSSTEVQP